MPFFGQQRYYAEAGRAYQVVHIHILVYSMGIVHSKPYHTEPSVQIYDGDCLADGVLAACTDSQISLFSFGVLSEYLKVSVVFVLFGHALYSHVCRICSHVDRQAGELSFAKENYAFLHTDYNTVSGGYYQ